jgi:hypothetical protein
MATALSPTSIASTSTDGPLTTRQFSDLVKYYQSTHKAIVRLTALVNKVPGNQTLRIGEHTIKKKDVSEYSNAYVSQLGDLRKVFANRKRKTTRNNSQLNSLFYVSDQLVAFYKGANLGPLDPASPKSGKLADHIDILISQRMSTSGILTSLISRYIDANNLKTPDSAGRFMPDSRMKTAFGTMFSVRKISPNVRWVRMFLQRRLTRSAPVSSLDLSLLSTVSLTVSTVVLESLSMINLVVFSTRL